MLVFAISLWTFATNKRLLLRETNKATPWTWVIHFSYYVVMEGSLGASLGKQLLGLRVTTTSGTAAGWLQILGRTAVFCFPNMLMTVLPLLQITAIDSLPAWVRSIVGTALAFAMFSAARRHNGWAGFHDLLSRTRVIARIATTERRKRTVLDTPGAVTLPAAAGKRFGPFIAGAGDSIAATTGVVVALDPVLRRRVWIQTVPPGTPPIRAERRDIGRTGRLFWLTGRRSELENWNAFEVPDGEPLLLHNGSEAEWPALKLWLNDLAHELTASADDRSTPPLALDRIWIRNDGRLVLLDFPAPGTLATSTQELSEVKLLSAVASMADVGASNAAGPPAIPLSARTMLEGWAGVQPPSSQKRATHAHRSHESARPCSTVASRIADRIHRSSLPARSCNPAADTAEPLRLPSAQNSAMMGLIEALHQPNPPAWKSPPQS